MGERVALTPTTAPTASERVTRPRGGLTDRRGILLYSDRAWAASRIEADGSVATRAGPISIPGWLRKPGLMIVGGILMVRQARKGATRFWDEMDQGDEKPEPSRGENLMVAFFAALLVGVMGAVWFVIGALVPAWPLREAVQALVPLALFITLLAGTRGGARRRRVLMLHGAEHKAFACLTDGRSLAPSEARRYSPSHPLCSVNFIVTLGVLATGAHVAVGRWSLPVLAAIAVRLVAAPFVVIAAALIHQSLTRLWDVPILGAVAVPGRALQRLRIEEPDDDALNVGLLTARALVQEEATAGARP